MTVHERYLQTDRWKELRGSAHRRDRFRCRLCNSNWHLQVHHRCYPPVLGTETVDDLTTLCAACHAAYHGKTQTSGLDWPTILLAVVLVMAAILAMGELLLK